ncbi:hypothetical protein [Larkinella rosea]|uniref:Uncharacterized protein n=1 Tax=Larkinella rosea TaxID=2025312 RepID=A0A3P1C355_9BACT|nr:hypothetical protein [Larkinella rosea]RRB07493.1 hypothetical protein EHT25_06855 [Larkinella rosea]
MKPVRFFTDQQTVWYNLTDYIELLLNTKTIHTQRSPSLHKRRRDSKSVYQVLLAKINRLSPVYQRQLQGEVYIDWVVFEHVYRFLRPFLVRPEDWLDGDRLFRQLRSVIEHSRQLNQELHSETVRRYFTQIPNGPPADNPQSGT